MSIPIEELVSLMVCSASDFVENYTQMQLRYYRKHGLSGPDPERFHAGVGDKLLFKRLMQDAAESIPDSYRWDRNAHAFAQRVLLTSFYPDYMKG